MLTYRESKFVGFYCEHAIKMPRTVVGALIGITRAASSLYYDSCAVPDSFLYSVHSFADRVHHRWKVLLMTVHH